MRVCVKGYCYNRKGSRKAGKKRVKKLARCVPGTTRMHGRNCMCRTRGGGYRTVAKKRCKR